MPQICLIQGSLNKSSKTSIVMEAVKKSLESKGMKIEYIDLRNLKLEFCDGRDLSGYNEDMRQAYKTMSESDGYIIGMPVYSYSISGVLKNFFDITCKSMPEKPFGIVSNSAGIRSYLASGELIKILSYEVNCIPVLPTVHTWAQDFDGEIIKEPKIFEKIESMISKLLKVIG